MKLNKRTCWFESSSPHQQFQISDFKFEIALRGGGGMGRRGSNPVRSGWDYSSEAQHSSWSPDRVPGTICARRWCKSSPSLQTCARVA